MQSEIPLIIGRELMPVLVLPTVLLKDEQADLDLAGPTLPVLKILTVRAFSRPTHEQDALPRVLNGMLSACLLNFDAIRYVSVVARSGIPRTDLFPAQEPHVAGGINQDAEQSTRSRTPAQLDPTNGLGRAGSGRPCVLSLG